MEKRQSNVLYITYDGLTDPLGQSQILPYLKGISSEYSISILSCEKEKPFLLHQEQIEQQLSSFSISWKYIRYTKSPPILSTFNDLWKMRKIARKTVQEKNIQIIHCRTILSWLIAEPLRSPRTKVIFDMRGYWADERVDGKLWNLNNPVYNWIYNFFKKKQIDAYHKADALISLTNAAKQDVCKCYGIKESKISVIPCNADQSHFLPKDNYSKKKEELKSELGIDPNALLLGYAGSLGTRYMLNEMLDCFRSISFTQRDAQFLIITQSPLEELHELIAKKNLKEKVFVSSTSYSKIPEYISLIDIALYFIYPGKSGKAVSPTKQAEFLSMGIPIITNDRIGDSKEIIEDHHLGFVVKELNDKSYDECANKVLDLLDISSAEIIKIAKEFFSLEKGIQTYLSVYNSL